MTKIRVLHVSDIHFGQELDGTLVEQNDIRARLVTDCSRMRQQLGPANGIIVSGDTAYGGLKAEYDKAGKWLDEICDVVGCERNLVHTIPGNHDIDRTKIDFMISLTHDKFRNCQPEEVNEILAKIHGADGKPATPSEIALFDKLEAYREFARRYESDFKSERHPVSIKEIKFPSGHVLRFLGLNSVQVSDKYDKAQEMVLGSNQYVFSEQENVEYVVMCHHPFDWFKDEAQAMPRLRTRTRVMLSGHEHQPAIRRVEENGSNYIMIDAGAANPPGSEKRSPHCYNWIEFEVVETEGAHYLNVCVYPRVWVPALADFASDMNRINGQTSQTYSVACPNYKKIAPPLAVPAASFMPLAVIEEEGAPVSDDDQRFAKLLYFFWRYLNWQQRIGVLVTVEVLPQGIDKPMPQVLERNALATARTQNKLAAVWDAVMQHVPADAKEQNPFS